MDVAQIISIVVNSLFALCLLFGFLWGLGRGLKKSALRLGVFVIFLILSSILSPYITKALLNMQFTLEGQQQSFFQFLQTKFTENPEVAQMIEDNPSILELVQQVIVVIANLIVFLVAFYLFRFVGWIVFGIVAKFTIKSPKKIKKNKNEKKLSPTVPVPNEFVPTPPKKRKLLGGLVGIGQGFIVAFVLFLPFSGLIGTVNSLMEDGSSKNNSDSTLVVSTYDSVSEPYDIIDEGSSSSSSDDSFIETFKGLPDTFAGLLKEKLPGEVTGVLQAYDKTAIAKVGGLAKFDLLCFDTISSMKVNGEKIVLRKELNNLAVVYNDAQYLIKYDWGAMEYETLDFGQVRKSIDNVFNFSLFRAILPEVVPYAIKTYFVEDDSVSVGEYTTEIKDTVSNIMGDYGSDTFIDSLKSDIFAVVGAIEELAKCKVFIEFKQEDPDVEKIFNKISKANTDGSTPLANAISAFISSKSLQRAITMGVNIGVNETEKKLGASDKELGRVTYSTSMWDEAKQQTKDIVNKLCSVYSSYKDLTDAQKEAVKSFSIEAEKVKTVGTIDFSNFIDPIGETLDILKDSALLRINNTSNIFKNIINFLDDNKKLGNANDYVDLRVIVNDSDFSFETELAKLTNVINILFDYDFLTELSADDVNIQNIVNKFKDDGDPTTKEPTVEDFFGPVLESDLLKPAMIKIINLVNDSIGEAISTDIPDIDNNANIKDQSDDIVGFIEEVLPVASNILGNTEFDIKDLDVVAFGRALEVMKSNSYTNEGAGKPNSVFKGAYDGLINYLKSDAKYGSAVTSYLSGKGNHEINWKDMFEAVEVAIKLSNGEDINPSDISTILDVVGEDAEMQEMVKDALKEATPDELDTVIDEIDLSDPGTQDVITAIASTGDTIIDGTATSEEIYAAIVGDEESGTEGLIEKLGAIEDQDAVNNVVEVLESTVGETIELPAEMPEEQKEDIENSIDASGLDEETKAKLKGMLGLGA